MRSSIRLIASLCACMLWLQSGLATATNPVPQAPQVEIAKHTEGDAEPNSGAPAREMAARDAHAAYWRGVAERLLGGQASAGACPLEREVSTCLLAARLLWVTHGALHDEPSAKASRHPERVTALMRSAATRAQEDPQALWMLARAVFKSEAAELKDRALIELRRREPDNLQVWLLSLEGETWTPERLQAAAQSTRFETYLYDHLRVDLERLAEVAPAAPAVEGLPFEPTAIESAHLLLVGLQVAEVTPSVQPLIGACTFEAFAAHGEVQSHCWRIAELMTQYADSVFELFGALRLMHGIAVNDDQHQRADQISLDYEYLQQGMVEALRSGEQERLFMQRMREPGATEISAARLMLIDAGLPPELPRAH